MSRKSEAREMLAKWLRPGVTVYSVLRSVSRSGMSRRIDFYVIDPADLRPIFLTGYIAGLLGMSWDGDPGLRVNGCGMDMGFHIVNNLSMVMFCPEKYTHDGAYALRHEWI